MKSVTFKVYELSFLFLEIFSIFFSKLDKVAFFTCLSYQIIILSTSVLRLGFDVECASRIFAYFCMFGLHPQTTDNILKVEG